MPDHNDEMANLDYDFREVFSDETYERIIYLAKRWLKRYDIPSSQRDAGSLANLALVRAIKNGRTWESDEQFIYFMNAVLRSLVSDEVKIKKKNIRNVLVGPDTQETRIEPTWADQQRAVDAHEFLYRKQRLKIALDILKRTNPDLYDFFVEVTTVMEREGISKDVDVERMMGLKPKTISEKRRQLERLFSKKRQEATGQHANVIAVEKKK